MSQKETIRLKLFHVKQNKNKQCKMRKDEERIERLKNIVLNLPECPGCYQYLNSEGVIIYVGKA